MNPIALESFYVAELHAFEIHVVVYFRVPQNYSARIDNGYSDVAEGIWLMNFGLCENNGKGSRVQDTIEKSLYMDVTNPQGFTNAPRSIGVTSVPSSAPTAKSRATENAYEKLSRDVHQMTSTGAIHHDWLENPKGFLLKPDFKRKLQHVGAGGKKLQAGTSIGIRLHMPGSTYRLRWFVLDGMVLRYFKTQNEEQELGAIHLASVNAVLPSSIADAPEFALDLVCIFSSDR